MARCPACGGENPDASRRCGACGAVLWAPRQRREERKVVTTLFCDLVGFTAMSETADPEDVDALLRAYNQMARRVVEAHGGVVEKYIGDAVVAVFGVPLAHEDDAERAVQAGLRIVEEAADLRGLEDEPLRLRVGVNTGEALVALDVDPHSGEGFLTGDAVNTASRLQSIAPPLGVVVGEQTHRLTREAFEYEELEPVTLKGKARPVPVWLARSSQARTSPAVREDAAFVGREADVQALTALFADCVRSRSSRSVLVVGEPGIGKSRLLAEFRRKIMARSQDLSLSASRWCEGRCLPYGEGVTFWALGEIVKGLAGVREGEDAAALEGKLQTMVPDGTDAPWVRRRLRPLVGLEAFESSRDENFAAWRAFLRTLAAAGPVIVVIEDLHWAEAPMLDFLAGTLPELAEVPLLVVATARPSLFERHPAARLPVSLRLDLAALGVPETGRLVASLLRVDAPPLELTEAVAERTGGNPLFAEELVRLLEERGSLSREGERLRLAAGAEMPVSDSVQALIAARLDALPFEAKAVLADAAVIGRVFWQGAVAALGGRKPDETRALLEGLTERRLVRPVLSPGTRDREEFEFWHALTRDVAYGQLTRRVRAQRHAAAAAWIEGSGLGRLEELAGILAHHCATALELARAVRDEQLVASLPAEVVRFSRIAGDHAMSLDIAAAERFYREALALAGDTPGERPRLLARLGRALLMTGKLREAGDVLEEAVAGLRAAGDEPAAAVAMRTWSVVLLHLDDPRHATVAAEAVALLEGRPPTPELLTVLLAEVGERVMAEDHQSTLALTDRVIWLAGELGLPEPAEAIAFRGGARCDLGDACGLEDYQRAVAAAEAQGLAIEAANISCNLGTSLFSIEGPRSALAIHREGREASERRSMGFLARACRMQQLDDLVWAGEWRAALGEAEDLIGQLEREDNEFDVVLVRSQQLLMHTWRGDEETTRSLTETVEADVAATDQPVLASYGLVAAATARLRLGAPRDAVDLLVRCCGVPNVNDCADYVCRLPEAVRVAVAACDQVLAERLADGVRPVQPLHENALASARACVAEASGRAAAAAAAFAAAASAWRAFGVPYEEAQARLGAARCLHAHGARDEARTQARAARDILIRLEARPSLLEVERML